MSPAHRLRYSSLCALALALLLLGVLCAACSPRPVDPPPPAARPAVAAPLVWESEPEAADGVEPDGAPALRLSELHYHPATDAGESEFIEIVNASAEAVSLTGWKLEGGVEFAFPPESSLAPGAFLVVSRDGDALRRRFGDVAVFGEYDGRLDNAGDRVRLQDATGRVVTDVRFSDAAPWPAAADGAGPSLQRVCLERDVDDAANWCAGPPTPGRPNIAPPRQAALSIFDVRHRPASRAPDSDTLITAAVFHLSSAVELELHSIAGGGERAARMSRVSTRHLDRGGSESSFAGRVPSRPPSSLVRYWITARSGDTSARSPPQAAPESYHAYIVDDPRLESELPVYHLFIERGALNSLLRSSHSNRLYPATFAHAGSVQVRLRGAWARSWPKKCLKIFFAKGDRFRKRDRLNLNSSWRDSSFVREKMAYDIFTDAGAPSLEARMVRLHINGEFWGLFVDVEQPKERYLRRVGLEGAALYKAVSRTNSSDERLFSSEREYASHYDKETYRRESFEEINGFCRALARSGDALRFFREHVDLPRYINYLCATTLTQNWDGFNKNHFIAYDRHGTGKWCALPWDLDRTLGDHWNRSFDSFDLPVLLGTAAYPGATGWNRLQDAFFRHPELKKRFMERLAELLETTFTEEALWPRLDRLAAAIAREADLDRSRWGGHGDWREGIRQVRDFIAKRREFLRGELPGGQPETPRALAADPDAPLATFPLVLETSPFRHTLRGVTHRATHWQIRAADGSYARPVVNVVRRESPELLSLAPGRLLPRSRYFWRAAHIGSNGKISEYSDETLLVTGEFAFAAVPFDLSELFNRDLVANPGDPTGDLLDSSALLIVDGFDGRRSDNPVAGGLPASGVLGVHRLGDYDDRNALQITSSGPWDVRIEARPGRYAFVRFVVAGGNGDSRIRVLFEYDDGTRERQTLPCADWYESDPADRPPAAQRAGSVAILSGMDRIRRGAFRDNNRPALFEVTLAVSASRTLAAIVLERAGTVFESRSTKFNLFAVTGIRAE